MVYPGTLLHRRQRGIPMHSYENRSQIRALPARTPSVPTRSAQPTESAAALVLVRTTSRGGGR
jgi:hypothetical protein